MKQLVHHLADLTALRDRDSLDAALITTLHELMQPTSLAIFRLVGPTGNERWLNCAQMQNGVIQGATPSDWTELEELPLATDFAARQQALQSNHPLTDGTYAPVWIFPLANHSESNGVLELSCQSAMSKENVSLVTAVLRLYQNFISLLDYGERDALTELLNRKTFDGAFLKATATQHKSLELTENNRRAEHSNGSYWLAMLDIDHFKQVNDKFGHLIGDEVLLLLARLMRNTFRFYDQLYRFGGEEFVVLMHCAERSHAEIALERLRKKTEQYSFPQVGRITISVGFTEIRPGDSPSGAFERADKAVYYAKEHGRNQVCGHDALVAQGLLAEEKPTVGDMELF
jgi:diguanylate cyclase (GGDEF)-like protein